MARRGWCSARFREKEAKATFCGQKVAKNSVNLGPVALETALPKKAKVLGLFFSESGRFFVCSC
jgi:hypothetical protein